MRMHAVRTPRKRCTSAPRLEQHERHGEVSDARGEVFDTFAARFEPVTDLPATEQVVVDASVPLERSLAVLRAPRHMAIGFVS